MTREKPLADRMAVFVRWHLGRGAFTPFTGTDWRCWRSFVNLLDAYSTTRDDRIVHALALTMSVAQESMWQVFVQAIAGVLDWGDVEDLFMRMRAVIGSRFTPSGDLFAVDRDERNARRVYAWVAPDLQDAVSL